jgi:HlyD family secretion protein
MTMQRRLLIPIVLVVALVVGVVAYVRHDHGPAHYTGFVEGEERVLRSEVVGRILEVKYSEGDLVSANEPVAVLDDRDIVTKIESKRHEIEVIESDIATQRERISLTENTWARDQSAHEAGLREAESAADLAEKTYTRERALQKSGASTAQLLDEARSKREQAAGAVERSKQMLGGVQAQERTIEVARLELATLQQKREMAASQLAELEVTRSKYVIRAPAAATVVQTQFAWPGELAQPGSAIVSVLDPADKYVQVYVPVTDVGRIRVGQRVEIELDSLPDTKIEGEISFIADKANFTPEKIETRGDRLGQVYRVKVRVLERVAELKPGTEGNVYLAEDGAQRDSATADAEERAAP